jgi:hypothetical protein
MDWAILEGLGAGLQKVGGSVMENAAADKKAALAEKLQQEREARAEDRQIAREQREQIRDDTTADPKNTDFVQDNGAWFEVTKSGTGKELDRRLAPQNKIQELNFGQEKDKVSLDKILLDNEKARREASSYDTDKSLERRVKESQIDYNSQRGLAATVRADNAATKAAAPKRTPTAGEVSQAVVKNNKDVIEQLGVSPSIAKLIADRVAANLIQQAQGGVVKDPSVVFVEALRKVKKLPSGGVDDVGN